MNNEIIDIYNLIDQQGNDLTELVKTSNTQVVTAINGEATNIKLKINAVNLELDELNSDIASISANFENEVIAIQSDINTLNTEIDLYGTSLAGAKTVQLIGDSLNTAPMATTVIQKVLFGNDINSFILGKTIIHDEYGTVGVYIGDNDSASINVSTLTAMPISNERQEFLGEVAIKAYLPTTISAAISIWPTLVADDISLFDTAQVYADETHSGNTYMYSIIALSSHSDSLITWGRPRVVNTSNYQEKTSVGDAGNVLIGGAEAGSFGVSKNIDIIPTLSSSNLITSGGVASAINIKEPAFNILPVEKGGTGSATANFTTRPKYNGYDIYDSQMLQFQFNSSTGVLNILYNPNN